MTGVVSYEAAEAGLADVLRQGSVREALVTMVLPGESVGGGRGVPVLGGGASERGVATQVARTSMATTTATAHLGRARPAVPT